MSTKFDFVICSLPRMSMLYPPAAPAVLKSILEKNGFKCRTKDFVVEWYNAFKDHERWGEIDSWNALPNFNLEKNLDRLIDTEVGNWANGLLALKAEWICLSIFSYESHKIGKLLSEKIKTLDPTQKILMGGAGITNVTERYAEELYERGLIDAFITGEGEQSIIELAKGNLDYPGINNKNYKQVLKSSLDNQPTPNFDDYDLGQYGKANLGNFEKIGKHDRFNKDQHTLPITSSKGCVKKCVYCDVPFLWPKFQHRGGELVADEIIQHHKKNGTRKFHFTDSLVNGSMKDFRQMIDILAKYNMDTNANITWSGQFIFRPNHQNTADDWKVMAQSGCSVLEVGIESGSEEIRYAMGKKFSNDDIEWEISNCEENKISCFWFMIIGYPTETEKNIREAKEFLERFHPYAYSKTVLDLELGGTLRIQPNTPLFYDMDKMGIEMITVEGTKEDLLWFNNNNPSYTLSKRILQRFELGKHAKQLGYHITNDEKDLKYLWAKWSQYKDIEHKFLHEKIWKK